MQATPPYDWKAEQRLLCKNCAKWLHSTQICKDVDKCNNWLKFEKIIEKMINNQ
jgi:hypothetical protein